MNLVSAIWRHRNEPTVMIFGGAMLVAVIISTVLVSYQVFIRNEAIVCGGQWFPKSAACGRQDSLPVGSIVPFFGATAQIPRGWHECNGETITDPSPSLVDAYPPKEDGVQVPDLRGKFIRVSENPVGSKGLTDGGRKSFKINHVHGWANVKNKRWFSYNKDGKEFSIDDWEDGLNYEGRGKFPLKLSEETPTIRLYTTQEELEIETLPPYVNLLCIIKVKDG